MDVKESGGVVALRTALGLVLLSAIFPLSFANQLLDAKNPRLPSSAKSLSSSIIFPIQGNVYPIGVYTVNLTIGTPPRAYDLDIDSGSDLTWVQCDKPCSGCTRPRDQLYKPNGNLAKCGDPLCSAVNPRCPNKNDQCDYHVQYADYGSSKGTLVRDSVVLKFNNGSSISRSVAFGCGYDQKYHGGHPSAAPATAGVLGLGNGKSGILSQLKSSGVIRNVVGHCLSVNGGGFIFLGDIQLSPGVVWTPFSRSSSFQQHYSSGPADLLFNGKPTPVKGLDLIFDSGSTYTYLNSRSHKVLVDLVKNDLKGKPLSPVNDPALPICWKGQKPFRSLADVKNYFNPLALSFIKSKNTQLQIPPEAYLIVTENGNACLGILDSVAEGLGNINIIGDISLQGKLVIYDNEKQQIGWVPHTCKL